MSRPGPNTSGYRFPRRSQPLRCRQLRIANPGIRQTLDAAQARVARAVLPLNTPQPVEKGDKSAAEKPKRLIDHQAFFYMNKRQGIAVIDLAEPKTKPYGLVDIGASVHAGAVLLHHRNPDGAGVAARDAHATNAVVCLADASRAAALSEQRDERLSGRSGERASSTMAQLEQVGHHNWGYRFQTITSAIGRPVSEVAASGSGETLVDAAVSCVATSRSFAHALADD